MNIQILSKLAKLNNPKVKKQLMDFSLEQAKNIEEAKNNDDIFEQLNLLDQYIYLVPKQAIKILKNIVDNKNPLDPVLHTIDKFGEIPGRSHVDLLEKSIELLLSLRYLEKKQVFQLGLKLSIHKEKKIAEQAQKLLRKIAEYDLHAMREIGYDAQFFILGEIEKFNQSKSKKYFPVLLILLEELLSPSFTGISWNNHNTMTIHNGSLSVNDALKSIRSRALKTLQRLFYLIKNPEDRKKILVTIQEATQFSLYPSSEELETKKLKRLVQDNTKSILLWYEEIISFLDLSLIKYLDQQIPFYKNHFPDLNTSKIEKLIQNNSEYRFYDTFVGQNRRIKEKLKWSEMDNLRNEEILNYMKTIYEPNDQEWYNRIIRISEEKNESNYNDFIYFENFLFNIGKEKPLFAKNLLKEDKKLKNFVTFILGGLWQNEAYQKDVKKQLEKYLKNESLLQVCVKFLAYEKNININFIKNLLLTLKKRKDFNLIGQILNYLFHSNHAEHKDVFLDAIKFFSENENTDWTFYFFLGDEENRLLELLKGKKEYDIILDNLIFAPQIRHNEEGILYIIAKKSPLTIIDFFKKRIRRRKENDYNIISGKYYSAIPMHLYKLGSLLQKSYSEILPIVMNWLDEKDSKKFLYPWEIRQLLRAIFGSYTKELESFFIKHALKNKKQAMDTLLVLRDFGDNNSIHKTCEEIIKKYNIKKDDKMYSSLVALLSKTGVVSGEYGFVEAYKKKKAEIQKNWGNHKNLQIKSFLHDYIQYLNEKIKYEELRANEDIALTKMKEE